MTDFFGVLFYRLTALFAALLLGLSFSGEKKDSQPAEVKQSDYISDPVLWDTPSVTEDGSFYLEIENSWTSDRDYEKVKESVVADNIGHCERLRPEIRAEEWGYSALNLKTGTVDGAGRVMENCFLDGSPANRAEALELARQFVMNQYVRGGEHPWASMNGHYSWHHYAGEWGFDLLGSEIGENIHGYQFHIAMNRGAARQYGKPWFMDFSMWHADGILDYSAQPVWTEYSGINNGHSVNLMERSFVASYMSGADYVNAEAGLTIAFLSETDGDTGLYKLSPYGEVCQRLNLFSEAHPDVGITYTPVAVVLDYYHGIDNSERNNRAFESFDYGSGDKMTNKLVDMIWKDTWKVCDNGNEKGALGNNSFGDCFDFILQNASSEVLASYPALVFTGDIVLSGAETERYLEYVRSGGILVLNTAYLSQFPEFSGKLKCGRYDITYGDGRVIVYGPDYDISRLEGILSELISEFVPFRFSSDIQHILNVRDGYMYLTLINNDGVTKKPHKETKINPLMKKKITAVYTGNGTFDGVGEIYGGKEVSVRDKMITVELEPGGIAVLEIKFR